jgi:hypothetical protein
VTEFNGFFKTGGFLEYVQSLWARFINLFSGWFARDVSLFSSGTGDPTYTSETRIAFVTESIDIHPNKKSAQFDKLFMANYGDDGAGNAKEILGLVEIPRAHPTERYVTVQYKNFNDVSPIIRNYLGSGLEEWAQGYSSGNTNIQLISLGEDIATSSKRLRGINLEGQKKSFEPAFDWRRITAHLRVDTSVPVTETFTAIQGNCHIDIGEECDYCEDGSVLYKFTANTCEKWLNNDDYTGSLSCVGGLVDISSCTIPLIPSTIDDISTAEEIQGDR